MLKVGEDVNLANPSNLPAHLRSLLTRSLLTRSRSSSSHSDEAVDAGYEGERDGEREETAEKVIGFEINLNFNLDRENFRSKFGGVNECVKICKNM